MLELVGTFFLIFGLFFFVMGVIGNIRLPDIFTRLHATSKVSLMGILGLTAASALLVPESAPKAIVLAVLILFSAPVASQAIARSAYRDGCAMIGLMQDDLSVQYIDFPYNYTIGEALPWANEPWENIEANLEANRAIDTQMPDIEHTLYGEIDEADEVDDEQNT
jgi:multicomponent Na+:H+ antiporter subunit G